MFGSTDTVCIWENVCYSTRFIHTDDSVGLVEISVSRTLNFTTIKSIAFCSALLVAFIHSSHSSVFIWNSSQIEFCFWNYCTFYLVDMWKKVWFFRIENLFWIFNDFYPDFFCSFVFFDSLNFYLGIIANFSSFYYSKFI